MNTQPIGFLDSGVGGVSVVSAARRMYPREDFIVYGDSANAPYGGKPLPKIQALIDTSARVLLKRNIKALVIACNTATSAYAQQLRAQLTIPVIGMEPALKPAHQMRHGGQIIVFATKATLELDKFKRLMELYGEGAVPVIGEGLVELAEAGLMDSPQAEATLRALLAPYTDKAIDAVVLGCTHYVFFRAALARVLPDVPLVDGNEGTARQLGRVLENSDLLYGDPTHKGSTEFLNSAGEESIALMRRLYELYSAEATIKEQATI